jgi:serine phosphatase RsbU (regulator of sigma subunit)
LKQYGKLKTDEIRDKILEALQGYTLIDDMTMVILKKK